MQYRDPLIAAWELAAPRQGLDRLEMDVTCPHCGKVRARVDLSRVGEIAIVMAGVVRRLAEK